LSSTSPLPAAFFERLGQPFQADDGWSLDRLFGADCRFFKHPFFDHWVLTSL
jgi:hypothetical protein